jgi:hypothetical protein
VHALCQGSASEDGPGQLVVHDGVLRVEFKEEHDQEHPVVANTLKDVELLVS